jgi:bifunctional ADP-heptose synthase (sugar kinase/adenylyltransferase)
MKSILIIGDSCKDIFVYCDAIRLAPDVPVPVLEIRKTQENPGMAMNVFRNIAAKITNCQILTNNNWEEITKTRYVHESSNHNFLRLDSVAEISELDLDRVNFNHDIIVISDYNKGFLSHEAISNICQNHDNVFIDTKKILGPWAASAKYIKINNYEYLNSLSEITQDMRSKLIHTNGAKGCEFQGKNYPVIPVEVKDTSGAGDSFMAALVVKYAETEDIEKSIIYANDCASKVVQQIGVTVI